MGYIFTFDLQVEALMNNLSSPRSEGAMQKLVAKKKKKNNEHLSRVLLKR